MIFFYHSDASRKTWTAAVLNIITMYMRYRFCAVNDLAGGHIGGFHVI